MAKKKVKRFEVNMQLSGELSLIIDATSPEEAEKIARDCLDGMNVREYPKAVADVTCEFIEATETQVDDYE